MSEINRAKESFWGMLRNISENSFQRRRDAPAISNFLHKLL